MLKKFCKTDIFFLFSIFAILTIHIMCIFTFPFIDESFYPITALRLINGDSFISDEWHLTQFSSIFQYLPVLLWVKIKGSTEGMIIFLRAVYILVHTFAVCIIYRIFRNRRIAVVIACVLFFLHIPYTVPAISYITIYNLASLFVVICLFKISVKPQKNLFVCAGFCFGCCCVCNPMLCFAFFLYLMLCAAKKVIVRSNKAYGSFDIVKVFFEVKSVLLFTTGISVIALISIVFYFATGGKLSDIPANVELMLKYSEYSVSVSERLYEMLESYNKLSLNLPFALPLLFVTVALDKNRYKYSHQFFYLFSSLVLCVLFFVRMVVSGITEGVIQCCEILAVFLPIVVFALMCYTITQNKNRQMFYCMFVPGMFFALCQFVVSRTIFAALGWALTPCAVAGVFFIADLFNEIKKGIRCSPNQKELNENRIKKTGLFCIILCFCLQLSFLLVMYFTIHFETSFISDFDFSEIRIISEGPAAGTFLTEEKYDLHKKTLSDLDKIKELSDDDDKVLLLTLEPWTYLYADREIASYTTWYEFINLDALEDYYEHNEEKSPDYIYMSKDYYSLSKEIIIRKMFDCKKSNLKNGYLFTVKY